MVEAISEAMDVKYLLKWLAIIKGSVIKELLMSKAEMEFAGFGEFKASLRIDQVFLRFWELFSMAFLKWSFLAALKSLLYVLR